MLIVNVTDRGQSGWPSQVYFGLEIPRTLLFRGVEHRKCHYLPILKPIVKSNQYIRRVKGAEQMCFIEVEIR